MESENLVFTRYLYIEKEVKQSLFISILNRNIQESLFWAFELYYSNYSQEEVVFEYIFDIYSTLFEKNHPNLRNQFESYRSLWETSNQPIYFANIVATLCTRSYDLNTFCTTYFDVHGKQQPIQCPQFIVTLSREEINKYKQHDTSVLPRKMLKEKCVYKPNKSYNQLFGLKLPEFETIQKAYYYNWLYYASRMSLWDHRIRNYNGTIDDEKHEVRFEDNDDFENFYNKYGYEPDEQSDDVQSKIMGSSSSTIQYTIDEFCQKYNFTTETHNASATKNNENITISMNK